MLNKMPVNSSKYYTFGIEDYVFFIIVLLVSSGIGVYFGFFGKRSNTTEEYLLGGNRMKTIPIGISLVASQLSAISFMANPAEVYSFGVNESFSLLSMLICITILYWITTPIFYNNNISNYYEYLELRFDRRIRQAMTAIFVLNVCLCMPVYILVPSLAFSQATGCNIHLINGIICFICAFYTMLGGIKAVVWTDVIQGVIMVASVILISVLGVNQLGGLNNILKYNNEGGRFQLNTNFDLTTRTTVWNTQFGYTFMLTSHVSFNQSNVQRIVALPSLEHAKRSVLIFGLGLILILSISFFLGLVLFAAYHDCDPFRAGLVTQHDKLMTFYIQDVLGDFKGLPGVFISAVFSASLSTMSAYINTLSGVVYFEYVKPFINHTESKANSIMKAIVACAGFYTFLGGLVVVNFKSLVQLLLTALGLTQGTIFGTFALGMLVPRTHASAALYGMIFSLIAMTWIIVGTQLKIKSGELTYMPLPTRVDGCDAHNITVMDLSVILAIVVVQIVLGLVSVDYGLNVVPEKINETS